MEISHVRNIAIKHFFLCKHTMYKFHSVQIRYHFRGTLSNVNFVKDPVEHVDSPLTDVNDTCNLLTYGT